MRASPTRNWSKLLALAVVAVIAIVAIVKRNAWWPAASAWAQQTSRGNAAKAADSHDEHGHDEAGHASHDHGDHEHAHDDANSLELSKQARLNLGLTPDQIKPVVLQSYERSFMVPGIVAERPGRTRIQVSAPLTGVVTAVHVSPGQSVAPGALLFEMRLTHEDLVQAQVEFLKTISELDVEQREAERLKPLVDRGVVPATMFREREYAADKLRALLDAQREALKLHGLSQAQVDEITKNRRLLREVQVVAPSSSVGTPEELRLSGDGTQPVAYFEESPPLLLVQSLLVHKGQSLTAGETMCVLSDYSELYIEGAAFDQDAPALNQAAAKGWSVAALIQNPSGPATVVEGLKIAYVANEIDVDSRTLHFYVGLKNELLTPPVDASGPQFVNWRFRPGQRLQLRIPVETFEKQIVLPVDAVARDGAEQYVFVENGNHFDRIPVHVKYRDQSSVVIAADGALFPGDRVAQRGAHQMQMALKNKSGGAVDPHAGHSH
jgi:multidrug efflux pump subunit AcrA (membrane-fusion protein)